MKINDEWVHVDATNNETNSGIPYLLYNSNDYYVKNNLEVDSLDEYKKELEKQLKEGNEKIIVRFSGKIDVNELMKETANSYNKLAPEKLKTAKVGGLGEYIVIQN